MTNPFQDRLDELSKTTLSSYMSKVSDDSQKHKADPTKRKSEKASKSVDGFAKASQKIKEAEALDEISDTKKREYLDAAVDNNLQQFLGRIPASKEKIDKRRAMIQKVATKVTGQKHYSDMDGKPYNAASGKKYSESVEMDEALTYTQKLANIRVDSTSKTDSNLLGKVGMFGGKSNLGNDAEYKKALDDAHAYGKEKFGGNYEITHVDHNNHKIRGGSVAKVRKGMAQTTESVEQIDELSQDTLKKAVASGKAKQKMAQSFADTSDREEDKDWHQSKADKFKAQVKKIASRVKESEELDESFSDAQIAKLKSSYSTISTIDPDSDTYKKLLALLDKQDVATLKKLADAKIKFVSGLALNRYNRKKPKNESVELDEKTLTVAKAMEKDQPGIDKSKKFAIATAVAKRVA